MRTNLIYNVYYLRQEDHVFGPVGWSGTVFVCPSDYLKSIKLSPEVCFEPLNNRLNFELDPDHDPDNGPDLID